MLDRNLKYYINYNSEVKEVIVLDYELGKIGAFWEEGIAIGKVTDTSDLRTSLGGRRLIVTNPVFQLNQIYKCKEIATNRIIDMKIVSIRADQSFPYMCRALDINGNEGYTDSYFQYTGVNSNGEWKLLTPTEAYQLTTPAKWKSITEETKLPDKVFLGIDDKLIYAEKRNDKWYTSLSSSPVNVAAFDKWAEALIPT